MELSKWIIIDGYCATRVKLGSDPLNADNRVAFIEKTPRIKIPRYHASVETKHEVGCVGFNDNKDVWVSGHFLGTTTKSPRFKHNVDECDIQSQTKEVTCDFGDNGLNPKARTWCDEMLLLLGYEFV